MLIKIMDNVYFNTDFAISVKLLEYNNVTKVSAVLINGQLEHLREFKSQDKDKAIEFLNMIVNETNKDRLVLKN